ncbi:MAG: response regulator [Polyangiaceae bacterium]|nr:response regulator [Polyangiaceae bacterium]MCW5789384.1 response regulator [Polyangiaceae bacterium]
MSLTDGRLRSAELGARGRLVKLLLVDDHVELAENLAEILESAGATCEVADSAEAALERLAAKPFQGLITDLRLPGSSGVDLIARIRAQGGSLPIVLLSAFATEEVVEQAEAAGAAMVLPKPVDVTRLLEFVHRIGEARSG